jgi:UDP-GlcNAc:undecaprenyl-phosphate/decaprenyl-phosphate GlcNAc-1-phosphate transferase
VNQRFLAALIAFVVALILALVLTPLARRLAMRRDALDHPEERRVNTTPVPRGGGLAVAAAFLLVAIGVLIANEAFRLWSVEDRLSANQIAALLGGGALAAALGTLDDWFDLRARLQLLGQLAVAVLAVALGITVDQVANPFAGGYIPVTGAFATVFTLFWIVGMINSINFIDGLDGLSSGIGAIAAVTLGVIGLTSATNDQPAVAILCLALAGALFGFLRWNWHPATIFSGTSGVMFLGYTLAIFSVLGTAKVAVALLVLGVPIIDTFFIIIRRVSHGRSPFSPDRKHLHHRLLDVGLSHRQTVVLIYAICAGLAGLSLVLSGTGQALAFAGAVVGGGLLIFLLDRAVTEAEAEAEAELEATPDEPVAEMDHRHS